MAAARRHHHPHHQPPLSNPFRAPRSGGNGTRHSHNHQNVQKMLLQACWIITVGAFLVTALSWAVPQPPAEQPILKRRPIIQEQQPIRKGGGVRGQSKLPPKKLINPGTSVSTSGLPGKRPRWDPDTLEHEADQHEERDDDEVPKSGDTAKKPPTEDSSNEDASDANPDVPEAKTGQSRTGPFGRDKHEEAASDKKEVEAEPLDEDDSGDYDPNDPDESHKRPPPLITEPKRKSLQIQLNSTNTTEAKQLIHLDEDYSQNKTDGEVVTETGEMNTLNKTTQLANMTVTRPNGNETEEVIREGDKDRPLNVSTADDSRSSRMSGNTTKAISSKKPKKKLKKRIPGTKTSWRGKKNITHTSLRGKLQPPIKVDKNSAKRKKE